MLLWFQNMLGRPNLARMHCLQFRILFHVSLPGAIADEALQGSLTYVDSDGHDVTLYGKSYNVGGGPAVLDSRIFRHSESDYHISLFYALEDRGAPPPSIKSSDKLMNLILANASADSVHINAYATFRYLASEGWKSRLVPVELDPQLKFGRGIVFTRWDGVYLSNVVDDVARESVDMRFTEDSEIVIDLGIRREKVISKQMSHSVLAENARISSSLVKKDLENVNVT